LHLGCTGNGKSCERCKGQRIVASKETRDGICLVAVTSADLITPLNETLAAGSRGVSLGRTLPILSLRPVRAVVSRSCRLLMGLRPSSPIPMSARLLLLKPLLQKEADHIAHGSRLRMCSAKGLCVRATISRTKPRYRACRRPERIEVMRRSESDPHTIANGLQDPELRNFREPTLDNGCFVASQQSCAADVS
jgi:hypothetical protein